jgi:hypothetical protein
MRRSWIVVVAALAGGAGVMFSDEYNRAALFNNSGYAASGTRFSVQIGESRDRAISQLRSSRALAYEETYRGHNCLMREYRDARTFDIFIDRSWRQGSICVISDGRNVLEVAWLYETFTI